MTINPEINVRIAGDLRRHGLTWRAIAAILASELGRPIIFCGSSVQKVTVAAAKAGKIDPIPRCNTRGKKIGIFGVNSR